MNAKALDGVHAHLKTVEIRTKMVKHSYDTFFSFSVTTVENKFVLLGFDYERYSIKI